MKKIILSLVLCVTVLLSCAVYPDAAIAPTWRIGDVDRDYELSILDVTRIQRYLAGYRVNESWYDPELYDVLCDADGNGDVSILDATCLQRWLANLPSSYCGGELTDYYVGDTSFHSTAEISAPGSDSSREVAYVGVPVTFYTLFKGGNPPQRFSLSINGVSVWQSEADGERKCAVTHTFTAEGTYDVSMDVKCRYGVGKIFHRRIDVISLPKDRSPVVMGATYYDQTWMSSGNGVLTVTPAGGTAPYEYSYTVYYAESPFDIPEDGEKVVSTGYVPWDAINPPEMLKPSVSAMDNLYIRITVRDAAGRESEPVTAVCYQYQICI